MKKKRAFRIVIITAIFVSLFFIGLYIYGSNSEPYKVAVDYMKHSDQIREELGPLKSYRLAIFGFAVRYDGPRGKADYKILARGEKEEAELYFYMEKSVGIWDVLEANMVLKNGETISLIK